MFILDPPYVSDFLLRTVLELGAPVLRNDTAAALLGQHPCLCEPGAFADKLRDAKCARLYCNSEDSYDWVADKLTFSPIAKRIARFKDKVAFRRLLEPLFPDFRYREVKLRQLAELDASELNFPLVIKPAVGFFSVGVHVVRAAEQWPRVVETLQKELAAARVRFSEQVVDCSRLIVEDRVSGEEFAIDAYVDSEGQAHILSIMAHRFASPQDVSDRIYYTSANLIRRWHGRFVELIDKIGSLAALRDFPLHLEVRVDQHGALLPIELNPQRFGGWCASDIAQHAFAINPYRCFIENSVPAWEQILKERAGRACAMVVADLPQTLDQSRIRAVDYDRFAAQFSKLLELRRIDYHKHPVFAFAFAELAEDELGQLDPLLHADLSDYATLA